MSVGCARCSSTGLARGSSVGLDARVMAQADGTSTRARPSLPGCFRQPWRRISRSAEATLILRTAASWTLVIQTPSVGSRSPLITLSVGSLSVGEGVCPFGCILRTRLHGVLRAGQDYGLR